MNKKIKEEIEELKRKDLKMVFHKEWMELFDKFLENNGRENRRDNRTMLNSLKLDFVRKSGFLFDFYPVHKTGF